MASVCQEEMIIRCCCLKEHGERTGKLWTTSSQVTLCDSMCRRPAGRTMTAVAQSSLETITMDTGVGHGLSARGEIIQSERGRRVVHVAGTRERKPDEFCCEFFV